MTEWISKKLINIADFNPKESIVKGTIAKKIAMDKLKPFCRDISEYEAVPFSGGTKFRNGDTIMARITPCLENGKTAKVGILDNGEVGFGSTEYIVFRAKKGVDEDFLYYLVCSPFVREPAVRSMVGSSGRQRVQIDVVQNLEIKIPTYDEQCKIASILKLLDDKIYLNTMINDNLLQQAQTIYNDWFVNYRPFGGTMPETWSVGTLTDLARDIICGKTPSTKKTEYYGNDIPFITIPDMHDQVYAVTTDRRLSVLGAESQKKKLLPCNSVCVSCIGTAGLVCLVAEPSQTNQQINSIIPKTNVSPYYIYLLTHMLSDTIQRLGSGGSTICNLNKAQFAQIKTLIPSSETMLDFDHIVKPMFETILSNQQENLQLTALRDILLPKLMSGELDVSGIDL